MGNKISGHSSFILLGAIQTFVLVFVGIGATVGFITHTLYFDHVGPVTFVSLILFFILSLIGALSTKLYFTFLVFQIIAFPSAVDNVIPGVYLGKAFEDNAIFPLLSHIDLYLFIGILMGTLNKKVVTFHNKLLVLSAILLFLSSFINIFYSQNSQDFLLVIAGLIHLRYLVWFYILFSIFDPSVYAKNIVDGLIISVIFLFVESVIFTLTNGVDRLTSGTLGNNSYGNIIACITVYFIFLYKTEKHKNKLLLLFSILTGITISLLTGTRMSIIGGCVSYLIGVYYSNRKSFLKLMKIGVIISIIILIALSTGLYKQFVPKRYDLENLTSKIHFNSGGSGWNFVEIERSWETNSILTRLKLYSTSGKMIEDSPFWGIGSMRWNYYKGEFGFEENLLLDSHNGYLAVLSQFGLLSVFFIYFIYFYPRKFLGERPYRQGKTRLDFLALIPLGLAICDLSNAGIFKHQIFGLLGLIVMLLLAEKARAEQKYLTIQKSKK